jgi:hypothetical protein
MGDRSRGARLRLTPLALMLATSALLAGCSHSSVPPTAYVTCTTPADGCTVASQMQTTPATMYLSGDGSLFVRKITWQGWGSGTATGTGTAWANNCKPTCAQGTFSKHPATIVLSDPESWHHKMAYRRQVDSVPAIHWRYTFARGLVPGPAPPAAITTPPTPGPVSTQATVSGTCTMGYEPAYVDSYGNLAWGPFKAGPPPGPVTISGAGYTPTVAYQVSLTNTGTATAQVTGFAVAFYDASGSELGSDQQSAGDTFITANQTLTWTMYSTTDTDGNGFSGNATGSQDGNIPSTGNAATCSFLQWYHP